MGHNFARNNESCALLKAPIKIVWQLVSEPFGQFFKIVLRPNDYLDSFAPLPNGMAITALGLNFIDPLGGG